MRQISCTSCCIERLFQKSIWSQLSSLTKRLTSLSMKMKRMAESRTTSIGRRTKEGKYRPIIKRKRQSSAGAVSCPICPKTSALMASIAKHLQTHFAIKEFACKYCKYVGSTPEGRRQHVAKQHKEKLAEYNVWKATDVNEVKIKNMCEKLLRQHMRDNPTLNLENSTEADNELEVPNISSRNEFHQGQLEAPVGESESANRKNPQRESALIQCPACDYKGSKSKLVRHLKTTHLRLTRNGMICDWCPGQSFRSVKTEALVADHHKIHDTCLKQTGRFSLHQGNPAWRSEAYTAKANAAVKSRFDPRAAIISATDARKAFGVPETDEMGPMRRSRRLNGEEAEKIVEPIENGPETRVELLSVAPVPKPNAPLVYICSFKSCGRQYINEERMRQHELLHEKTRKSRCINCKHRTFFRTSSRLCARCSVKEARKAAKTSKPGAQLLNQQTIICFKCNQKFPDDSSIRTHLYSMHPTLNSISCIVCGYQLESAIEYYIHFRAHDYDWSTPYTCTHASKVCKQRFSSQEYLNKHMQSDHSLVSPSAESLDRDDVESVSSRSVITLMDESLPGMTTITESSSKTPLKVPAMPNVKPPVSNLVNGALKAHNERQVQRRNDIIFNRWRETTLQQQQQVQSPEEFILPAEPVEDDPNNIKQERCIKFENMYLPMNPAFGFHIESVATLHQEQAVPQPQPVLITQPSTPSPVISNIEPSPTISNEMDATPGELLSRPEDQKVLLLPLRPVKIDTSTVTTSPQRPNVIDPQPPRIVSPQPATEIPRPAVSVSSQESVMEIIYTQPPKPKQSAVLKGHRKPQHRKPERTLPKPQPAYVPKPVPVVPTLPTKTMLTSASLKKPVAEVVPVPPKPLQETQPIKLKLSSNNVNAATLASKSTILRSVDVQKH